MEALLLIKATLRIYLNSIKKTYEQFIYSWKYLLFHLIIAFTCLIATNIIGFVPGILGSFLFSIFLALAVSCYLASILATYSKEKKSFQDLFYSGLTLFNPILGILFSLFILHLLTDRISPGFHLFIGLATAIILNPMPELIQLKPSGVIEMFSDGLEFVRDNLVEWNLPFFLFLAVIYIIEPNTARSFFYYFSTTNPIDLIQIFLLSFGTGAFLLFSPLTLILLVIFYLLFLFRLNLFYALSSTSHRKRIYSERNR